VCGELSLMGPPDDTTVTTPGAVETSVRSEFGSSEADTFTSSVSVTPVSSEPLTGQPSSKMPAQPRLLR
jgi:hypothetical protein